MILRLETHFDAAHYLPNYNGKCANLHGHTYRVIIEIDGQVKENGMVEDFTTLKTYIQKTILDVLDHTLLNELFDNPTCENIAKWIKQQLLKRYNKANVTVYEGLHNAVSTGW